MTGKTHVTVGLVSMGCLAFQCPDGFQIAHSTVLPTVALITTAAGSYLPDIDLQQSHLGQKYYFISKHLKHRGLTHYWYFIPVILLALTVLVSVLPLNMARIINIVLLVLMGGTVASIVLPALKKGNVDLIDLLNLLLLGSGIVTMLTDLYDSKVACSLLFGLFFGWIMHIFADLFNGKGIPLVPGSDKHFHIMNVKTISYRTDSKGHKPSSNWQEPVWLVCYCAALLFITFKGYLI